MMDDDAKLLTKTFGKTLQLRRKALGLSQETLAERVGIGQQALSRMERGEIAPKFERLQLFADALRCRVVDLLNIPEESPQATMIALEKIIQPLNAKQRSFLLKQMDKWTEFLTSEDDD